MKNLQLYVSFDNETVREDRSRTKLGYQGVIHLVDGARNKAARPFVLPLRNEEGPKFHFTLSPDAFRFKDDSAFTVALWVRGGGTNGVAFALTQDTIDLGPKLLIKSSLRSVGVELFCDESDSEKKFVRAKSIPMQSISTPFYHIALTRSGDGTLTAYVDAVPITDAPEDSLPTKQPVAMKFKQAGFGLRPDSAAYTIELDEFCMFDRALSSDEIKTLAGKGSK